MIVRLLIVVSIMAAAMSNGGRVFAQAAFPAPLPGQTGMPAGADSSVPHVNGAVPPVSSRPAAVFPSGTRTHACENDLARLREATEKHARSIRAAADRRAPPDEACTLIGHFSQAELKLIKFFEVNAARCGTGPEVADRWRIAHKNTETIRKQVCSIARQQQQREPAGPVGDFWPASSAELAGSLGDLWMVR